MIKKTNKMIDMLPTIIYLNITAREEIQPDTNLIYIPHFNNTHVMCEFVMFCLEIS